jgi:hypothetical protein
MARPLYGYDRRSLKQRKGGMHGGYLRRRWREKIFGNEMEKVIQDWIELYNEDLHILCSPKI